MQKRDKLNWKGVCWWRWGNGTEVHASLGQSETVSKMGAQILEFGSLDRNNWMWKPTNQTCLHPLRGGCLLHRVMLSPPWPAGLVRPAGRRGRRGQRRWWRQGGLAGSGPVAEGSWVEPGPGAETAGEPEAAAAQNTNQTQFRNLKVNAAYKSQQNQVKLNSKKFAIHRKKTPQIMFNI